MLTELSGVAIDLGGTKIAVARFERGEVIDHHVEKTAADAPVADLINQMISLVRRVNLVQGEVIGVAVTGRIDAAGNWYAVNTRTLSTVEKIPLQKMLNHKLEHPCVVLNDAITDNGIRYL